MPSLVPHSSLLNVSCRVRPVTLAKVDGALGEWTDDHLLPRIALEDPQPYATVWAGWSTSGLGLAFRVPRTRAPRVLPKRPTEGDCIEIYIDTRDVRTAHRASRYCHKFVVAPAGGPGRGRLPLFEHQEIPRALGMPPQVEADAVKIGARVTERQYTLEMFLPAAALNGYDVEENRRLGLAYLIRDIENGVQSWPHGEVLPVGMDPSLWATVELAQGDAAES